MVLAFFAGEILLTFALVLLVKNKTIIIIVVYLNHHTGDKTPYQCKISKIYLANTWILCIDYERLHRGVDFRSVMSFTHFFYIFNKYLTFHIVLWYTRHS